jgi:enoyl-CoA hydratase
MAQVFVQRDGLVATVVLSNHGKLNALNIAMWQVLAQTMHELSQDESLRCVILRGDGGNFAAGADVEEFPTQRNSIEQGIQYHNETVGHAIDAIANCMHPTIAAIEGVCVGGGLEIACACDLRIASPSASFGIPIKRLGFPLAPPEMQNLVQLVGLAITLEILLEGRVFDATEAMQKGLLNRIVDDVPAEAQMAAQRITEGAPLAARMNKRLARQLAPLSVSLTQQEIQNVYALLESKDYREGIAAFLEKRKPSFTGS